MEVLKNFLFPKRCVICETEGKLVCEECYRKLERGGEKCPMCCKQSSGGKTHVGCRETWGMDGISGLCNYRQIEVRKIVKGLKYGLQREVVGEVIREVSREKFDVIVPVPLHAKRLNFRGFNQARVIAEVLEKKGWGRVVEMLKRVKDTKPLAEMKRKEERYREIEGAFGFTKKEMEKELKGRQVLVVDDVFTSGATMGEAAKMLKKAGAREVWGWVLAMG